jgi:hypothetical protein
MSFYSVNKPKFNGSSPRKIEVANQIANQFGATLYNNRIWKPHNKAEFFIAIDKVEVKKIDIKVQTELEAVKQNEVGSKC